MVSLSLLLVTVFSCLNANAAPITYLAEKTSPDRNAKAAVYPFVGSAKLSIAGITNGVSAPTTSLLAVPTEAEGNFFPLMNLNGADPGNSLMMSSRVIDMSFACYDNFKEVTADKQTFFSGIVSSPSDYYGIARYYFSGSGASLACNDINSQIRLATSLKLAGLFIVTENTDVSPLNTSLPISIPSQDTNGTGNIVPTAPAWGALAKPANQPLTWPVDVKFLLAQGSKLPVWGVLGPASNYILNQLAVMEQGFSATFPNASKFAVYGPSLATNASTLNDSRLVVSLGQQRSNSNGMWEFTLILVVVLLAVSFATSIAIHCHLFRMRRRNAELSAAAIVRRLDLMNESSCQILSQTDADKLPTKIFCRSARHEQKRAFAALSKRGNTAQGVEKGSDMTLMEVDTTKDGSASLSIPASGPGHVKIASVNDTLRADTSCASSAIECTTFGSDANSSAPPEPQPEPPSKRRNSVKSTRTCKSMAAFSYVSMDSDKVGICSICLEEYVDEESIVKELPCQHYFHTECIDEWLTTQRNECPLCKCKVRTCGCSEAELIPVVSAHLGTRDYSAPNANANMNSQEVNAPVAEPAANSATSIANVLDAQPAVRFECVHERDIRLREERQLEQLLNSAQDYHARVGFYNFWPFNRAARDSASDSNLRRPETTEVVTGDASSAGAQSEANAAGSTLNSQPVVELRR